MKLSKYVFAVALVALIPLAFAAPARAQDPDEEELVPETVTAPDEDQTPVTDDTFVGPPAPDTAPATEFVGPPAPQKDPDTSLSNALVKDDTSSSSSPLAASLLDDPNRVVSDVPDPLMQNILTAAQTGDGLAQNDNIVRGLRAIPGGNPNGPALDADVAAWQRSAEVFRTAGAAAGGQVAGPPETIGSTTRGSGWFSGTPDVSIGIDGNQETIAGPPTSRGDTTTFSRVPQPGGGYGVEARNASGTYTLSYTNGLIYGRNYSWNRR